jgi:hypothetical protein
LLSLYLAALGFGAVLVGASLVLGGDSDKDADKDFDKDFDKDLDAAAEADAEADADVAEGPASALVGAAHASPEDLGGFGLRTWLPLASVRFWSFGGLSFGLVGTLMSLTVGGGVAVAVFASVVGWLSGVGATAFFRRLRTDMVSGDVSLKRYVGEEAKVVVRIRPGEVGKIAFQTLAGRVELMARTQDAHEIEAGSTVLCAHIERDGTALVTSLPGVHPAKAARETA